MEPARTISWACQTGDDSIVVYRRGGACCPAGGVSALECLGAAGGLGQSGGGILFKGLKKWPPLRRFLFGAGAILVWLAVYSALFHAPAQDLEHRTIRMEAVVTQWPEETDYGVRVPVWAGEREGRKVSALFYGPADLADLRPGDRISCVARCTPAEELGGEESLYYPSQGILLRMKGYGQVMVTRGESSSVRYALTILTGEIRAMLDQLYPPREAGFLHALLTGDKTGLEETDPGTTSTA